MADIELVIKIPKIMYGMIKQYGITFLSSEDKKILRKSIEDGTPLPKGHGDLIDVNRKITFPIYDEQYEEWGEETLTVREALNRWSDEGITVKDVVILADKSESEVQDADSN